MGLARGALMPMWREADGVSIAVQLAVIAVRAGALRAPRPVAA
ncbi:hypothetical protein [Actinomadura montaniterrae]|nr:hypothetical protein [Actinomadura montaniterrae]